MFPVDFWRKILEWQPCCRELWYRGSLAWQHILASPAETPLVVAHNAVNQVKAPHGLSIRPVPTLTRSIGPCIAVQAMRVSSSLKLLAQPSALHAQLTTFRPCVDYNYLYQKLLTTAGTDRDGDRPVSRCVPPAAAEQWSNDGDLLCACR